MCHCYRATFKQGVLETNKKYFRFEPKRTEIGTCFEKKRNKQKNFVSCAPPGKAYTGLLQANTSTCSTELLQTADNHRCRTKLWQTEMHKCSTDSQKQTLPGAAQRSYRRTRISAAQALQYIVDRHLRCTRKLLSRCSTGFCRQTVQVHHKLQQAIFWHSTCCC